MSATFTLTLDTTAPEVSWGAQTGATAGELLQLAYASDEPIASADLTAIDGTILALTVEEDVLSVLLPPQTPIGPARVRVRDALGNTRSYPGVVSLQGTVVYVPPAPPAVTHGVPRARLGPRSSRRRIISTRTLTARSRSTVTASSRRGDQLSVTCSATVVGAVAVTVVTALHSRARVRSTVIPERGQLRSHVELAVHRRDGPGLEELILLDLL